MDFNKMNYEKVFNVLVNETITYIKSNNLHSMVLGISGGIDSTVVAAICYEVSRRIGIPLIGRSLPIKNDYREFSTSQLVGEAFCNDFKVFALGNMYSDFIQYISCGEATEEDMGVPVWEKQTPIANGNIQARLRMIYLYNLASIHKGIVMSTDNQTEYQLGFWTLHGDVGDFDPLQDLWKTEVYELAKWLHDHILGEHYDKNAIDRFNALKASIALTPTDGLGISNSDLDQIGAKSYDEVDDILRTLIPCCEWRPELGTIQIELDKLYDKYGKEVVDKVWNRHTASKFKREKAPIYIPRDKYDN